MKSNRKHLLVIGGPTASGKTSLSIRIASKVGCEILSADSRQFYREMTIGTAKPSNKELALVRHHFINSLSIYEVMSVGRFERDALDVLDGIYEERELAILVGGSGLYLKAVCEGLDVFPEVGNTTVDALNEEYLRSGLGSLQEELRTKDPEYARIVDIDNPHRVIRALAVIRTSGLPFSKFLSNSTRKRRFQPLKLCLALPREVLYERIERRVDEMVARGLEAEARALYPHRHLRSLQTVGYREWFAHFDGDLSYTDAIEKIKQHSRNYAKRQMTWFKNQGEWTFFNPEETSAIEKFISQKLEVEVDLSDS